MKAAFFHPKARSFLKGFPEEVRREFGKAIFDLQKGQRLSMPLSRPMPLIAPGVEELRRLENAMAKNPERAMDLMMQVWKPAVARVHEEVADMQALADCK